MLQIALCNVRLLGFVAILLLQQISAANISHLAKKQQQQQQPQANMQPTSAQNAQHQQNQQQQQIGNAQQQQPHGVQYVHENEPMHDAMKSASNRAAVEDELGDPYQILSELKQQQESRLPVSTNFAWNPFIGPQTVPSPLPLRAMMNAAAAYNMNPFEHTPPISSMPAVPPMPMPKLLPFVGYAQPVLIPFPMYVSPDMFYPAFAGNANELDDVVMSRAANGRRPVQNTNSYQRNSPIYYVRMPPTPYMFVPNMNHNPFGNGFSPLLTYQPMPTFSTFGSVFNLPVNFLANGKPSSIYQMGEGAVNDAQNSAQHHFSDFVAGFNTRPPTPTNPYRPGSPAPAGSYVQHQSYGLTSLSPPQQDSKMTSLKRPFLFNGRPEDIYIMPNNFNPLYSENNYY